MRHTIIKSLVVAAILIATTFAQSGSQTKPQLQVVGTAHLDTQWRWTIQNSINEYIPNTFRDNFKLMELYPDYVFSFEGSFRYMILREYYPEEWEAEEVRRRGQWRVTGSWVDAVDVNIPRSNRWCAKVSTAMAFTRKNSARPAATYFCPIVLGLVMHFLRSLLIAESRVFRRRN